LPEIINQITFLSAIIFTMGLLSLFRQGGLKTGTIIIFLSCCMNFTGFSNFNSASIEGQIISLALVLILFLHLFIQHKTYQNDIISK
jgi:hypothetical protein